MLILHDRDVHHGTRSDFNTSHFAKFAFQEMVLSELSTTILQFFTYPCIGTKEATSILAGLSEECSLVEKVPVLDSKHRSNFESAFVDGHQFGECPVARKGHARRRLYLRVPKDRDTNCHGICSGLSNQCV